MRTQIHSALHKLAGLPVLRWGLWRDKRWQKNAIFSIFTWALTTGLLYAGINRWGHEWRFLIAWNVIWDAITFFVNKKKIFADRQVSFKGGGATIGITAFCFVYHKATLVLLVSVFGLGILPIRIVQGAIGIIENPVRFKLNNRLVFVESGQPTEPSRDPGGSTLPPGSPYPLLIKLINIYSSGISS